MKASLFIKQAFGALLFFTVIFICAGRFFYWQGLVYTSIGLFMFILNFTALRLGSDLMNERSRPGKDAKQWDKLILGLSFLTTIGMFVIGGLDSGRFLWSPDFPPILYAIGITLTAGGQLLFLIAQKQNKFFSSTVRIQTDRGHTVCETGLYKVARHPAYMGSVIQSLGFPLFFGSLWSIIPVFFSISLLFTRTYLEDKTLKNELNGYLEYSQKTCYRLVPFIW
jgi:protein-S-isoprenylcysteine O-methyltransferase Ste14